MKKGDLVRWRGHGNGQFRVERVYSSGELRIESVEWPGAFHMVCGSSLEMVRPKPAADARKTVMLTALGLALGCTDTAPKDR